MHGKQTLQNQPIFSGAHYKFRNSGRGNYLTAPYRWSGSYYAYTGIDTPNSPPKPHKLVKKSGDGIIHYGDELYILASIGGADSYLRSPSSADCWYESGDSPGAAHTWCITGGQPGTRVMAGDTVQLASKDPGFNGYFMVPLGDAGYVQVQSNPDNKDWSLALQDNVDFVIAEDLSFWPGGISKTRGQEVTAYVAAGQTLYYWRKDSNGHYIPISPFTNGRTNSGQLGRGRHGLGSLALSAGQKVYVTAGSSAAHPPVGEGSPGEINVGSGSGDDR
ncbi:MAG TPA: hypothetical protein VIG99_13125 [Myxococcaceae bacterium]|jgi:hypothetical protein